LSLRGDGMHMVSHIDAHERLAGVNVLADINQALCHFPRNSEPKITLNPSGDDTCKAAINLSRRRDRHDAHKVGQISGILMLFGTAARDAGRKKNGDQNGERRFRCGHDSTPEKPL
jgi:hypothetical protein